MLPHRPRRRHDSNVITGTHASLTCELLNVHWARWAGRELRDSRCFARRHATICEMMMASMMHAITNSRGSISSEGVRVGTGGGALSITAAIAWTSAASGEEKYADVSYFIQSHFFDSNLSSAEPLNDSTSFLTVFLLALVPIRLQCGSAGGFKAENDRNR